MHSLYIVSTTVCSSHLWWINRTVMINNLTNLPCWHHSLSCNVPPFGCTYNIVKKKNTNFALKCTFAYIYPRTSGASSVMERKVDPPRLVSSSTQMVSSLAALLLASATYYYSWWNPFSSSTPRVISALPESYALCTTSGKVYTVNEHTPNVDCILVRKGSIAATGPLGSFSFHYSYRWFASSELQPSHFVRCGTPYGFQDDIHAEWDIYQNEVIKMFYGNELSAKKPLPVYQVPSGAIVVPGLAGAQPHSAHHTFSLRSTDTKTRTICRLAWPSVGIRCSEAAQPCRGTVYQWYVAETMLARRVFTIPSRCFRNHRVLHINSPRYPCKFWHVDRSNGLGSYQMVRLGP